MSITILSTNPPADELVEEARKAYERRQALKAQQSGDSPHEQEMEHETPTDDTKGDKKKAR